MMSQLRLSILDYSPVDEGLSPSDGLAATVRLAQHAEESGFIRFWVSEHHGIAATASNSPEILMARIASATQKIRVGSGAVLLPNYSSLKIAENYQLLTALFPDRVDLGFGRAPGADRRTGMALNDEKRESLPYTQKVSDLLGFLTGLHPEGSRYEGMHAHPVTSHPPQPYVLGASGSTAELAAHAGLGFTFAHFINPHGSGPVASKAYRAAFEVTEFAKRPSAIVAVFVAVGSTAAEADEFADAFHLWLLHAESTHPLERVPSLAATGAHDWRPEELLVRERHACRIISGTAVAVAAALQALMSEYDADEVMINLMMPGETARLDAISALSSAITTARNTPVTKPECRAEVSI